MKKTILTLLLSSALTGLTFAQKISADNVPAAVTAAFKAKFSIAEKTSWEIDYDNYEAEFKVGKSNFSAIFDKDGKWLKTTTYTKPSELPKVIKDSLSKVFGEHSGYKIEEAAKVETASAVTYEMEIEKGEVSYNIVLSEKGEMIKREEKKEEKHD